MADERNYTAVEHAAILETQVANKTADLRVAREGLEAEKSALQTEKAALETEKAALLQQIDKLEAEKAIADKAKTDAEAELADFKTAVARDLEIAGFKVARVEAVKAQMALGDEYFTPERTQRWAEMTEAQFAAALADLAETSAAMKKKDDDSKKDDTKNGVDPDEPDEDDVKKKAQKAARETAAFKGGSDPSAGTTSTFMQLMAARNSA